MDRGTLRSADRIALIAVWGIVCALAVWVAYAWIEAALSGGVLTAAALFPELSGAWGRMLAVVGVLSGTLALQIVYARKMDTEHRLNAERSRTREMYESSPDAIVGIVGHHLVAYANPRAGEMAGSSADALLGRSCHLALYGRQEPCAECPADEVFATGEVRSSTARESTAEGPERYCDKLLYPVKGVEGVVESVVEVVRDVTDLKRAQEQLLASHHELESRVERRTRELSDANERLRAEVAEKALISEALAESEERYRGIIEHSPDMVLVHRGGHVSLLNPAGLRMLGTDSLDDVLELPVESLWAPNGSGLSEEELRAIVTNGPTERPIALRLRRLDGALLDVELSVAPLLLDGAEHVQCVARDITERLRAQETIKRMAYYDPLTGLPNRTLFLDRLRTGMARVRRAHTTLAIAFLDLDDFKVINDTLGHPIGDAVLKAVGDRVSALLRDNDTVARQSGDEFTILAELTHPGDVDRFAERVLEGLRPSFTVEGHELHMTASLGIALYPEHGDDEPDLLKNADTAMYRAKELGHNRHCVYRAEMGIDAAMRLSLENELRRALAQDEFALYYQPQVDIRDGRVVGVEALLRWNHPERGVVAPDAFLGVAEQAGLVSHIGRWVLSQASTQARRWIDEGIEFGRMAVNLSAREFMQQDIVPIVSSALVASGLPARALELEITESVALHNVDHVRGTLTGLRELGVGIAIDDFGTGYSAMSYLQTFPINTLKIAQAFMRNVCEDEQAAAIATTLIDLGAALEFDVVAEGVETEAQIRFLAERACWIVQGYAFCRPLPPEQVAERLRAGVMSEDYASAT